MKPVILVIAYFLMTQLNAWAMDEQQDTNPRFALEIRPPQTLFRLEDFSLEPAITEKHTVVLLVDIDDTVMSRSAILCYYSIAHRIEFFKKELINQHIGEDSHEALADLARFVDATDNPAGPYYNKANDLVEPSIGAFLQSWKDRGAIIIGFTARHFSIAETTTKDLLEFNINFSELSGCGQLSATSEHPAMGFKDGILYTGNKVRKAYLTPFIIDMLKTAKNMNGPFFVGHLDDSEQEISTYRTVDTGSLLVTDRVTVAPFHYVYHSTRLRERALDSDWLFGKITEELLIILGPWKSSRDK